MIELPPPKIPRPLSAVGEVDEDTKSNLVRRACKTAAKKVHKKSESLAASGKAADKKRASEFELEHVYLLTWLLLLVNQIGALRPLFPDEPRRRRGVPSLEESPFYWLLLLVIARGDEKVSEGRLLRTANFLLHAHRHNIPPYLVVEFIKRVKDPKRINQKVANGEYEPWHPNYKKSTTLSVTSTRANVAKPISRGVEPDEVDDTKWGDDDQD